MKRSRLVRHLLDQGCLLVREGSRHSIWRNPAKGKLTAVPRHADIKDILARKICRDLEVEVP